MNEIPEKFDVVILGGAFAGASTALLLRRRLPKARILILEKATEFDHKVGEATVEVSGFFLKEVLGQSDHLTQNHRPKNGLRFWFSDRPDRSLQEMSEVGPQSEARLPSYLIDRKVFDEHLLRDAERAGAYLWRPAKALSVDLQWPMSLLTVSTPQGERTIHARWVVDATGRQAFLARKMKRQKPVKEHPVASVWARWENVANLDGPEILGPDPQEPRLQKLNVSRQSSTNHFCGYGWWCWSIALPGGRTSLGVVYHKELFEWPSEGTTQERYEYFLRHQPGLRDLLAGAHPVEGDFRALKQLTYSADQNMDKGWALVSDAAAFLDPYYSPGLDHGSITVYATCNVIAEDLEGNLSEEMLESKIGAHNGNFQRSISRWLDALYLGKYEIFGDAELTATSFLVDTSLYYLGVVGPVYRRPDALTEPVFGLPILPTFLAYRFMRFFKGRQIHLARQRRKRGTYGRRSAQWRLYVPPFYLGWASVKHLLRGVLLWTKLEFEEVRALVRDGG